ncbi:DUF4065 domain-containing protein [Patescibacteria group bacterium]|nr:DUF4065 domain-containing protein [Patescibacteria group bacterium]MBU2259804.1 DUF4065 domain-containing protein [Patescibacteria group bacterium]
MTGISTKSLGQRIRKLRTDRSLSQDDLAKALGLHRQSVSLLEKGERDLTATELDELARFLQVSYDDILAPEVKEPVKGSTNKGIRFQPEKLKQLLLFILEEVGGRPNVGETVLYKLLYFCDFNHFEKTGKPITGMTYRRLQFGPVPQLNQFSAVVEKMLGKKQIQKLEHEYFGKPQMRYISLCDPDRDALSDGEIATIREVTEKLGRMSATQIEEYVHGDAPWEVTEHQAPIAYELVHWRTEPYALYTEEEVLSMMQDAAVADSEKHLDPLSQEEIEYYENLLDLSNAK